MQAGKQRDAQMFAPLHSLQRSKPYLRDTGMSSWIKSSAAQYAVTAAMLSCTHVVACQQFGNLSYSIVHMCAVLGVRAIDFQVVAACLTSESAVYRPPVPHSRGMLSVTVIADVQTVTSLAKLL